MTHQHPKVENHCHFGGMLSPELIHKIAGDQLGLSVDEIRNKLVCQQWGEDFYHFLDRFNVLNGVVWTPTMLETAIHDVCHNLSKQGVSAAAISLSLNKYINKNMGLEDVVEIAGRSFSQAADTYGVECNLLLSLRYKDLFEDKSADTLLKNLDEAGAFNLFCGIDIVGDEMCVNRENIFATMRAWKDRGKTTRIHAGELDKTGGSIQLAIDAGVSRIAHGTHATDEQWAQMAEKGIVCDMALNSNMILGFVSDIRNHPIKKAVEHNCIVTISSDDPVVFNCTLDDEYRLLRSANILSDTDIDNIARNSWIYRIRPNQNKK